MIQVEICLGCHVYITWHSNIRIKFIQIYKVLKICVQHNRFSQQCSKLWKVYKNPWQHLNKYNRDHLIEQKLRVNKSKSFMMLLWVRDEHLLPYVPNWTTVSVGLLGWWHCYMSRWWCTKDLDWQAGWSTRLLHFPIGTRLTAMLCCCIMGKYVGGNGTPADSSPSALCIDCW